VEEKLQEKNRVAGRESILETHGAEIMAAMEVASVNTKGKRKADAAVGPLAAWKDAYQQRVVEEHPGKAKKSKRSPTTVTAHDDDKFVATESSTDPVELYGIYHSKTIDELKDVLRHNRQVLVGTKDVLLYKVIDGARFNGRLSHCPLCRTGRLKIDPVTWQVRCNGTFDESVQRRMECHYKCAPEDAPRHEPFYQHAPTPAEEALMDEHDNLDNDPDQEDRIEKCRKALRKIVDWDVTSKEAIRRTTQAILTALPKDLRTQLPDDPAEAQRLVGPLLLEQPNYNALSTILVQRFSPKPSAVAATAVDTSPNAALVAAFAELSQLYFKTGNPNAGRVYQKVVGSVQALPYAITPDNCRTLGKGKNKIENIGKSTLEKIVEFATTGTMQKLEEKRADAA
jgi:Helix-hairpin-helix domain